MSRSQPDLDVSQRWISPTRERSRSTQSGWRSLQDAASLRSHRQPVLPGSGSISCSTIKVAVQMLHPPKHLGRPSGVEEFGRPRGAHNAEIASSNLVPATKSVWSRTLLLNSASQVSRPAPVRQHLENQGLVDQLAQREHPLQREGRSERYRPGRGSLALRSHKRVLRAGSVRTVPSDPAHGM
jgi:hypothetical protein